MVDAQSAARKIARSVRIAAAAAALLVLSPAAQAQGLFSFFGGGPSPYDIETRLEAAGYTLTAPLIRRGDVYLADVVYGRRESFRLVIDAESGRIMQRFRARPAAAWRDPGPRGWGDDAPDAWGAPRPPGEVDLPPRGDLARGENPALGTGAPRTTSLDELDKSKPKPHETAHKPAAPASAAKTTVPPAPAPTGEATPAPVAPSNATPAATPSLAPQSARAEEAPAQPAPTPIPAPSAKTDAPPASAVAAAKPPSSAATPDARPSGKAKPVNDLPVTPLD